MTATTPEEIRAALVYIPAHDRDLWVRMGLAVKSELGEPGFTVWDEWSRSADNYEEKAAKEVWKSIHESGGVGIGTLFYEAKQRGMKINGEARRAADPTEIERLMREREERAAAAVADEERVEAEAAERAAAILNAAQPAPDEHPYLRRKGARAYPGIAIGQWPQREKDGCLLIPLRDSTTKVWNLQAIFPEADAALERDKDYLFGGRKRGCYFGIGKPPKAGERICIAEGYATAASIHAATSLPAVVAFDAGNLLPVAHTIAEKYPAARLVVCADNDISADRANVGVAKAGEAARAVRGVLAVPQLGGERCDFNDLYRAKGARAVAACIEAAHPPIPPESAPPSAVAIQPSADALTARPPLDWPALAGHEPPPRRWAIKGWLGFGHTTLLVGSGGIGKTLVAQQAGSALALGSHFVDDVPGPLRVLMWACEDDHDELWRRQVAISRWLDAGLDAFAENLIIVPRHGLENTLVSTEYGRPMFTTRVEELRQQAADLAADVVILDNAAQLYGGGENDRHAVTIFLNALSGVLPGRAVLLLAHPARAAGSEFSGSSAWENVARTRLYLGAHLPDQKPAADEEPADDVRYLARRKSNYSNRDWRRFSFRDGVLIPDAVEAAAAAGGIVGHLRDQAAERIVLEGLRWLQEKGIEASEATNSPQFLPRLLVDYKRADGRPKAELAAAMRRLRSTGSIDRAVVGKYSNRSPKYGLKVMG